MVTHPNYPAPSRMMPEIFTSGEYGSHTLRSRPDLIKVGRGAYMLQPDPSLSTWAVEETLYLGRIAAIAARKSNNFAFSHGTAAFLHGFSVLPRDIYLTQPARDTPGKYSGTTYYQAVIPERQICDIAGLPVTTIDRTLRDCALRLPVLNALVIADQALRKLAQITRFDPDATLRQEQVRTHLLRLITPRQPGAVRARAILEFANGLAESPKETELRLLCALAGIPAHFVQHQFVVEGAEYFTDLGWEFSGRVIAAEYDGTGKYASDPHTIRKEKAREIALNSAGVQIVRFQSGDLHRHSLPFRTLLKAIRSAGGPIVRIPRGLAQLPATR